MAITIKEYVVLKASRVAGHWRNEGDVIELNDIAARYPVMTGQIALHKATAKKAKTEAK